MKNIRLMGCCVGVSFLLFACNSTTSRSDHKTHIGYFVTVFDKKIDYSCENKRSRMNDSGKFECASFPIAFYSDNIKLGEINSIHEDGYVYPQDIIVLEEQTPIYTSDNQMGFLSIE